MDALKYLGICGLTAPVALLIWNVGLAKVKRHKREKHGRKRITCNIEDSVSNQFSAENPEIIIVGSGIVGSALAATLGKDGRYVTVIERDLNEPDRIVGELLQPGGVRALHQLGLSRCLDNIDAQEVRGYVVHDLESASHVDIPYPACSKGEIQEGRSFHHGRFVQSLRAAAQEQPTVRYFEATVSNLLEKEDKSQIIGVEYKLRHCDQSSTLYAPLTIVCDGHFSRFRKVLVRENVKVSSQFVGLLMENCPQYAKSHAELVLGNPSPVLIYRISDRYTRVLVDIQGQLPKNLPEYMVTQVAPQLPEHIREPFMEAIHQGSRIRSMPSSFLPARPHYRLGAIALGDAYNMRHPLTGGGMSVGFHDVIIWRDLLRDLPDCSDVDAVRCAQITFHRMRKKSHAFVVNILAQALYALFSASDKYLYSLRRACFGYFKLGGECVAGPVGLLSILHPQPWTLIGHFFAVAFYAVYRNYRDIRSIKSIPSTVFHPFGVIYKACAVIIPLIWSELKTIILN